MMNRLFCILISVFLYFSTVAQTQNPLPFSTDSNYLTFWNGTTYEPFFIKGTNLGIARPGTYPGEMAASREDYQRWFKEIKAAGFNSIRLYTLHFPSFYEELRNYNLANPQKPLFFFQGVWLNEELEGYDHDLYMLADTFKVEIAENIDCVHGNRTIPERFGKASGIYTADVSQWHLGFLIGREIYPEEVLTTNIKNTSINSYKGNIFSIQNASPAEVWITEKLNYVVDYERTKYNTERPVSASSWPTLDPIHHPLETVRMEDTAQIDLSKLELIDAPAGIFISYHAYPYYPDFISNDPVYKSYSDEFGQNSYIGYLTDLKSHYKQFPLLIAEVGVPSSWASAHYTSNGMNHGGFDEKGQGDTNMRLLSNIKNTGMAGGIQFAWIDEWFKNTWLTDIVDFGDKVLWHNVTAAEQNFGLKKFTGKNDWIQLNDYGDKEIKKLSAKAGFAFLELKLDLKNKFDLLGECWIALDTYNPNIGESVMPNGETISARSEFALHITQHSARLYVTQAYDLYGLWHGERVPTQRYKSIVSDGAPWNIVRWKNNAGFMDVQYVGELKLNKSIQPPSSIDAVTIFEDKIEIRIPWSYINVVDPSKPWVFDANDDEGFYTQRKLTDGFMFNILFKNEQYTHNERFKWNPWTAVPIDQVEETTKASYWVMYNQLSKYNTKATALPDEYIMPDTLSTVLNVNAELGVMKNDYDMDSKVLSAVLTDAPTNGFVDLRSDGSFLYIPRKGFEGIDIFKYAIFDEKDLSTSATVKINVTKQSSTYYTGNSGLFTLYPNPSSGYFSIKSDLDVVSLKILDANGRLLKEEYVNSKFKKIDISDLQAGLYFVITNIGGRFFSEKLVIK